MQVFSGFFCCALFPPSFIFFLACLSNWPTPQPPYTPPVLNTKQNNNYNIIMKGFSVPSLARSVPKPLKRPSLARSAPKPLKGLVLHVLCTSHHRSSLQTFCAQATFNLRCRLPTPLLTRAKRGQLCDFCLVYVAFKKYFPIKLTCF